jgi:sulfur-carrier protein adenylyltransferase/sulfurtransferase
MARVPEVSVHDLAEYRQKQQQHLLLDVRREDEYEFANLDGLLIPLDQLEERVHELEPYRDVPVIVQCRSGARSARAAEYLRSHGFDAHNLAGGILAWSKEIDPSVPTY